MGWHSNEYVFFCRPLWRVNTYKRTYMWRIWEAERELQMFNKIDGTNVIINQNTNLIIITEISISYHLYALSAHTQIETRGHSWIQVAGIRRSVRDGESESMCVCEREITWNELKIAYAYWERKKQANQVRVNVCFSCFKFEQWNAENIEQMRKCLVFIYSVFFCCCCWKIDVKIWKNEVCVCVFLWKTRNKTAATTKLNETLF